MYSDYDGDDDDEINPRSSSSTTTTTTGNLFDDAFIEEGLIKEKDLDQYKSESKILSRCNGSERLALNIINQSNNGELSDYGESIKKLISHSSSSSPTLSSISNLGMTMTKSDTMLIPLDQLLKSKKPFVVPSSTVIGLKLNKGDTPSGNENININYLSSLIQNVSHKVNIDHETKRLADEEEERLEIPLFTSDHEDLLLREAGSHEVVNPLNGSVVVRDFIPCKQSSNCVGFKDTLGSQVFQPDPRISNTSVFFGNNDDSSIKSAPEGFILMAYMTPTEYQQFIETGIKLDKQRNCILCNRKFIQSIITCIGSTPLASVKEIQQKLHLQMYRNDMDREGGYKSRYCILPNYIPGIVYPIVRYQRMLLNRKRIGSRGYIIQDILKYNTPEPLNPNIGESVENF